jgi:two-component system, LytTR family, sensor histidine kinase AgrC
MNRNKLKLILLLSIILLLFFTSINIYTSYSKIKSTVQESIANQNLEAAKSISASLDVETYKRFLENPVVGKDYWEIRKYLNDAREKIGVLYVYTLKVDNPNVSYGMILGVPPEERGFPIGDVCTVPPEQVSSAFEGKTYVTGILVDPIYGDYLSVGAPIKDDNGEIVGYLGIDISADVLNGIGVKVLENSVWLLVFNGLFVIIVIVSVLILQSWYQKEVRKEIEDTEDIYQKEFKGLISTVQSVRHDFLNHIQVLHGLLQLKKWEEVQDYVSSLVKEARTIDSLNLDIGNPGLSVLLQTKKLKAQNQNINIHFEICKDSFEKMKTTDLIKIFSNLIDNAIEASVECSEEKRMVHIEGRAETNRYEFTISNTGPKIIDKHSIFTEGYSTKKATQGKIRGQGLFIVKEVVHQYEGKISIESTDEKTTVIVIIPVKN